MPLGNKLNMITGFYDMIQILLEHFLIFVSFSGQIVAMMIFFRTNSSNNEFNLWIYFADFIDGWSS